MSLVERRAGRRRAGRRRAAPTRGDPGRDLGVGRRHDLAAVAEVDLVAVVLRAGCGSRSPSRRRRSRARGSRRRAAAWAAAGAARSALQAGAGHHLGGVAGEDVGVVAGVVPDHDGGVAGGAVVAGGTPRGRPRRGCTTTRFIRFGAGAERAAQAGGAELQRAVEAVGEVGGVAAGLHVGDDLLELGAGLLVGVLGGPGPGPLEQASATSEVVMGGTLAPARRSGESASWRRA